MRDRYFLGALLLGPLAWLVLAYWLPLQWADIGFWRYGLLVAVYPILEEIVFRGWLQGRLQQLCAGKQLWPGLTLANVITSVVFVAFHLLYQPWLWALAVFFPSLVFGFFRDRFQAVSPAIVLHVFYNAGFFLLFAA